MLKFRNFSEFDFRNYPGAEKFKDGTEPMICEFEDEVANYTILLHADKTYDYKNCLVIIVKTATDLDTVYLLTPPTKHLTGIFANEIITYLNETEGTYSDKLKTMMNLFRFDKF